MRKAAAFLSPSQLPLDATTLKRKATSELHVICNVGAECGTCDDNTRQGKTSFYTLNFQVDEIMNANSHKIFRLPSYHTGLKPVQFIRADEKHLIGANK